MNKPIKYALLAVAAVLGLVLVAATVAALRFDPNAHKAWLIERVQQTQQRSLAIPGRIELSLFPSLGLRLGELSLSERAGPGPFAAATSARASLAVLPLLSGRLVVNRVQVDGLRLQVQRRADGSTSIDDLLAPPKAAAEDKAAQPPGGGAMQLDIAGIELTDTTLQFDDRLAGRSLALSGASLRTGRIRPGEPVDVAFSSRVRGDAPLLDAALQLQGALLFDAAGGQHRLRGMSFELSGRVGPLDAAVLRLTGNAGFTPAPRALVADAVELTLRGRLPAGELDAQLQLPALQLAGEQLTAGPARGRVTLKQGAHTLSADLSLQASGDLSTQVFELSALRLQASLPNPRGGAIALQASGSARAALAEQTLQARLDGQFDGSPFDARLTMTALSPAAWRAELGIDRLDLDRYLAPAEAPDPAQRSGATAAPAIDLSALQGLMGSGTLRVGALRVAGADLADLRAGFRARGGRLDVEPIAAELYQGRVAGSLSAVHGAVPQLALKQQLDGVAVGPLLTAVLGQDRLSGRGDVTLDLRAQGASVDALKKSLAGNASLALRDGAVRGFNIAQALRSARAALGRSPPAEAAAGRGASTDFSELSGSFRIADGVARTDDLAAKSPLLRVGAVGSVDIGAGRLDMGVRATVVSTLQGQGGPDLQALRGATLPVRLTGPFDDVGVKVDLSAAVQEATREKVEDAARGLKEKAREKLGDRLKGLFGK